MSIVSATHRSPDSVWHGLQRCWYGVVHAASDVELDVCRCPSWESLIPRLQLVKEEFWISGGSKLRLKLRGGSWLAAV